MTSGIAVPATELQSIVEAYGRGERLKLIARRHRIEPNTVSHIIRRLGIPCRNMKRRQAGLGSKIPRRRYLWTTPRISD